MATREYIGARYVPKFYQNSVDGSTQWQPNVVYEPLMWVTLQNSHMYISKKQVPATVGTPAENIDYWLDIGSYNGIIENLQNQIDDITDVTIPAIEADIDALEEHNERYFMCVGDSYTVSTPTIPSYWKVAKGLLGYDDDHWKESAVTGFGFGDGTFLTNLQAWYTDNAAYAAKVTDFFVMGGYNDAGYAYSALLTPIANFINYAKSIFPNLRNFYVCCFGWGSINNYTATRKAIAENIRPAYRTAMNYGCIYMDDFENVFHNYSYYQSDNVHPDANGQNYAGYVFANYIKTGSCKPISPRYAFPAAWTGALPTDSFDLTIQQVGDKIIVRSKYTAVWTAYTDITGALTEIATISERSGVLLGTGYLTIPAMINGISCQLLIDNNKLYIKMPDGATIARTAGFYLYTYAILDAADC